MNPLVIGKSPADMLVELLHDEEELVMLVCCWELLSICELLPIWIDGFRSDNYELMIDWRNLGFRLKFIRGNT